MNEPGAGEACVPLTADYLALKARYRIALLIMELAHLRVREHELQIELAGFVRGREGAIAAAELAGILERIGQGKP